MPVPTTPRNPPQLLAWQWSTYVPAHRTRRNLLIHIVAVPLFVLATLAAVAALIAGAWLLAVFALFTMAVAFAAQGVGHRGEPQAPVPFAGPGDFFGRIFAEQFITFPRFVLSGGWRRALNAAHSNPQAPHSAH